MIMKHFIKILILVFCTHTIAQAQNAKEAIQNTKQIITGKKMLERDIKELHAFKSKVQLFTISFEAKDTKEVASLTSSILLDMTREVEQSCKKAKMARKEIAQSSAEVRSDRRENRRNREDSERTRYDNHDDQKDEARDRANTRDDRRDKRDDKRDFQQQIHRAEQQTRILKTLKTFNFSFDESNFDKALANKKLIADFLTILQQDIEATKRELAEDKREQREDRRERRDDQNERNEIDSKKRRW